MWGRLQGILWPLQAKCWSLRHRELMLRPCCWTSCSCLVLLSCFARAQAQGPRATAATTVAPTVVTVAKPAATPCCLCSWSSHAWANSPLRTRVSEDASGQRTTCQQASCHAGFRTRCPEPTQFQGLGVHLRPVVGGLSPKPIDHHSLYNIQENMRKVVRKVGGDRDDGEGAR